MEEERILDDKTQCKIYCKGEQKCFKSFDITKQTFLHEMNYISTGGRGGCGGAGDNHGKYMLNRFLHHI